MGTTVRITEIEGYRELQEQFARMGKKFPKPALTRIAKAGLNKPLAEIKANMLVGKTGMLKKGIKAVRETPNKRNKVVYRVHWNKALTPVYLKETSGAYGGKSPAYYPHSIEYGWKTKTGHHEGYHIAEKAIEATQSGSIRKMFTATEKEIEKLTR